MRRLGRRTLMAAVGLAVLAFYVAGAVVSYAVLVSLWRTRPDLPTTVTVVVGLTLLFGYLSYHAGISRMLVGLQAVPVDREHAPDTYRRLDRLVATMDVDHPRLLIARMRAPNALVLGGRTPTVVVDRSLFRLLDADELETILAHELAHLESRDALVQTLGYAALRTVAGLVLLLLFPVLVLVSGVARAWAWFGGRPGAWADNPVGRTHVCIEQGVAVAFAALTLLVLAHSRRREFAADARAAAVTGKPVALARALRKLERAASPPWDLLSPLYTHTESEHDNPVYRLFDTHPSTDERVERLSAFAERNGDHTGGRRIPVR